MPPNNTFDAIVIGSGISGGWAAKELCEAGLKTLLLERRRNITHIKDYPTATMRPWEFPHRGIITSAERYENPIASSCSYYTEQTKHFFAKDADHPYIQHKPFYWIRGYQVGGKSLIWNRQTQRFSDFEFNAPACDGFAIDWPIRYADIASWYSYVEKFIGVSGNKDGLPQLPDGEFLSPWEMNCVEKEVRSRIVAHFPDRPIVIGHCAHLTQPQQIHLQQGRQQCQARNMCNRGCPFGGYFSSNSGTIPWAQHTGNLTLRTDSVVHSIIYNEQKGKATGVRVIDAKTKEIAEFYSRIIFVNASALNSVLILLNSTSARFPNGLGNDYGLLGKYISFHNYRDGASGTFEGYEDSYYYGCRPTMVIIPNFRNLYKRDQNFLGGYLIRMAADRNRGATSGEQIGCKYKEALSQAGSWRIHMSMRGEIIPKESNQVYLSSEEKDPYGIPKLITSLSYDNNNDLMVHDFQNQAREMLQAARLKNIDTYDTHIPTGLDIHEMGGCRMGRDPKTSLLNGWNQLHVCTNVLVTDGAYITSTGTQNPSLTYMAFTARAVNHVLEEMKKGNL